MSKEEQTEPQITPPASRPHRQTGRRQRRLRGTIAVLVTIVALAIAGGLIYQWLNPTRIYTPGEDLPEITRQLTRELPPGAPDIRFTDVTKAAGLGGFHTFQGPRSSQLPEDMGSGAAWGDYDNDGDDDLFLVAAGGSLTQDSSQWAPSLLYENRDGTFVLDDDFPDTHIIGMGAAWGDYDGDGWLDLVVTGHNALRLFRNDRGKLVRDHRFTAPSGYWAGAAWADFNHDGRLDLYVCGYVRYVEEEDPKARTSQQFGMAVPYTLNPSSYEPESNLLFLNLGDGRFREVAAEMGVSNPRGRSLTGLWHDFDQDGWLDLYVANDVSDNALLRNTGKAFEEISHSAWVADYRGAMGLAVGDYNRDGDDDIFVTHWIAQENALYDSLHADSLDQPQIYADSPDTGQGVPEKETGNRLRFMDVARFQGLGQPALKMIGWGAEFADFDGDGWLDLVVANGSTFETSDTPPRLKPQTPFLFWNRKGEHFHNLGSISQPLSVPHVNRGIALSDYDRDGDVDILIVRHGEGVQLLRNEMQTGNWLQVRLQSRKAAGSPAFGQGEGAVLTAFLGDVQLRRPVASAASYLSQSSRVVHFGLGSAARVDRLEVKWNGGGVDVYEHLEANSVWEIQEGTSVARKLPQKDKHQPDGISTDESGPGSRATSRQNITAFWVKQRAAMHAMKVDGDLPTAVLLFQEALELNPEHEDARYYLGNSLADLGRSDEGIVELRKLLEINPRSHRTLKQLAMLLAQSAETKDQWEEVTALMERALAINREETGVLLAMGEIALIQNDHDTAEQRLEWASRTNPRAVGGFFFRGYLAWSGGNEKEAQRLLVKASNARGEEWKPEGATAEGDVKHRMHTESTPLGRFWREWDGALDPGTSYSSLDTYLKHHPMRNNQ